MHEAEFCSKDLEQIFDLTSKIILQTNDVRKYETQNASDVLKTLQSGKISLKEAKDLMAMFHTKMQIEELPELLAKLAEEEGR